ncbi:MAG: hypothetical protein V1910_02600 [bacterium]
MSWAQKRKISYIVSVLFIFIIILVFFLFIFLIKKPTCFDGKQNQKELGIDCGGPCNILCSAEYSNLIIVWGPRWAKILNSGMYNFLTYIQNPNIGAGAFNVPYFFKVYDKNNVLLYQKTGKTYIPPNNNFVVFEDNINLFDKIPARTDFEFIGNPIWQKMNSMQSDITTISKTLINEDTKPKLLITLKNSALNSIKNIEAVAILYDENNNAITFSRTKIDSINADAEQQIVFTWPEKFEQKVVRIDIVSKVLSNVN